MAGSKPGERRGGRKKGAPNKVTLERAAAVQSVVKESGQTLALDQLRELAAYHKGVGAKFQPVFGPMKDKDGAILLDKDGKPVLEQIGGDDGRSVNHLSRAERLLMKIVEYESPRLQSTTIRNDQPDEPLRVQIEII